MLVGILSGESPVSGTCPVATVVISGGGAGDQSVGSPDVKVLVGWGDLVSSDRRASKSAGCSESEPLFSLENQAPHENRRVGILEVPRPSPLVEGQRHWRRNWVCTASELPVVPEDDMPIKNANESTDPLVGRLGAAVGRTAKASRISRFGEVGMCLQVGRMGPVK